MPTPPTPPSPPIPQEPFFPRLLVSYYALYVIGQSSIMAITYNQSTGAWTVTPAASQYVSISTSDPDQTSLSLNGTPVLFMWNATGAIGCGGFTDRAMPPGYNTRLDFYRKSGPIPRKFASLSQAGMFYVNGIQQKEAITGTDRMFFFSQTNSSIGLDGLLAPIAQDLCLLVDNHGSSSYYVADQAGLLLASIGGN
jgi:hypothetical protein